TPTSPYGRMARVVVIEKRLEHLVEVVAAETRKAGSPYYGINPSGRVPYLERSDGPGLEDSSLICAYFDKTGTGPQLVLPPETDNWEFGRLEMLARSFVDGVAVLVREKRRPASEQSPTIVAHEEARARRLISTWENELSSSVLTGPFNMAQLVLACGLQSAQNALGAACLAEYPALSAWFGKCSQRASMARTHPSAALHQPVNLLGQP
ncbi:MAG TPA: glutathione S-transferase N-terminal domain-containing protein, partial [Hyphomicrobiaceae bacterium]|nr:glutathione S-transferase N-terminal domain-containing protein [Hyphomicrobiaceae bacterium]